MTLDASIAAGAPLPRYAHAKEMLRTALSIRASAQKQRKLEIEASRVRLKAAIERLKSKRQRASKQQNRRAERIRQTNRRTAGHRDNRRPAFPPDVLRRESPQAFPSAQTAELTETIEARTEDRRNIRSAYKPRTEASQPPQPCDSVTVLQHGESADSPQLSEINSEATAVALTDVSPDTQCDLESAAAQPVESCIPARTLRPSRMEILLRYKRLRKQLNANIPSVRFIELIGQQFEKDDQTIIALAAALT